MAQDFAPILKNNEPENFLNYSRGYEDRSGSTLFRGLGEALDSGIKAVDRGLTQRVQDEVRAAVENADAALGVNANPRMDGPELPTEVVSKIERLRVNREAMLAGRLNPEHYHARLLAESKKIRSRWGGRDGASGYTEQIDAAFKELIGTTPANALRRELQAQAEAATNAARAGRNSNQSFIDSLITQGRVPPKFLSVIADPSFASNEEAMMLLKAEVANNQAFYEAAERDAQLIELSKKRGEVVERDAGELYGRHAFKVLNDTIERGSDYQRLNTLISKAKADRESGRTMNPEELGQIRNLWGAVRQQLNGEMAKLKIRFGADMGKEGEKYDSQITGILNDFERGLTEENVGLLQQTMADAKVLAETGKAELLGYSETMRAGAALRTVMGDAAYGSFLSSPAGQKYETEIANFGERAVAIDAASGAVNSALEAIEKHKTLVMSDPKAGKEYAKVITGSLDKITNGIFDPRIDVNTRVNLFNSLYGKDNQRMWLSVGPERKRQLMLKLLSPTAYSKVKELSTMTGNGNIMDNYERTLANLSYETAKPHIDTLNEIGETVSDKRIDYDPTTNRIRVVDVESPDITEGAGPLGGPLRSSIQYMFNRINASGVVEAQEDINTILAAHETVNKAKGFTQEQINIDSVRLLNKLGVNLGQAGRNILERALGAGKSNVPPGMMRAGLTEADVAREAARKAGGTYTPEQGTAVELDELFRQYNETTDEEFKAQLKTQIFDLMTLDREKMTK